MLISGAAALTAGTSVFLAVVLGVVAVAAIMFFLVRVLGALNYVVMAIKSLVMNSGAAYHILRSEKGHGKRRRSRQL
jgi:hypothetical protein